MDKTSQNAEEIANAWEPIGSHRKICQAQEGTHSLQPVKREKSIPEIVPKIINHDDVMAEKKPWGIPHGTMARKACDPCDVDSTGFFRGFSGIQRVPVLC